MEIIRRGTDPSEKDYEGTCNNCKTIVRFKKREAKYTSDQREGSFLTVKCPVCVGSIYVNA